MELKDEADAHKQYVLSNFLLLVFWCKHASAGLCSEAPEHQQVGGLRLLLHPTSLAKTGLEDPSAVLGSG